MADYERVEIINGAHNPPYPFVVVDRFGMLVDLSKITGQLWDDNVSEIIWGHRTVEGRRFGTVRTKTGAVRIFSDRELIDPYVKAWKAAKANHDLKEAMAKMQREEAAKAEAAENARKEQERAAEAALVQQ